MFNLRLKRLIPPFDDFFEQNQDNIEPVLCLLIKENEEEENDNNNNNSNIESTRMKDENEENEEIINCEFCNEQLLSISDYELHYQLCHMNVCSICQQVFPTERLLSIHISELHDSFFKIMSKKQPMYECLISNCNCKFNSTKERDLHMTHCHHYPVNFSFHTNNIF
ncbi:hypothetical protein ABK040_014049 [Willaertia magna]